jgi:hypothetical protein
LSYFIKQTCDGDRILFSGDRRTLELLARYYRELSHSNTVRVTDRPVEPSGRPVPWYLDNPDRSRSDERHGFSTPAR